MIASPRILSVDDQASSRYLRRRALEAAGFEVDEAETGQGALALAATGPDLVLLDVNLPDISGVEVSRRLRAHPATSSIPIVHISATSIGTDDRTGALEAGGDAFLVEPVERGELVAVVRALLRSHRAEAEIRGLQEHTAEALRVRDEFLAVAAHELLGPLSGARLRVQRSRMLLPAGSAEAAGHLDKALATIDGVAALVSQLLDFSRTRSGVELARRDVDLSELVAAVVSEITADASPPAVIVRATPGVRASVDPDRMAQVVRNLVANALRYGGGRPVRVEVTAGDGRARIAVSDQGPGIPPDDRERIFDPYVRLAGTVGGKGLGLGLAIVRSIMQAHGGQVGVESSPGAGATFIAELPYGGPLHSYGPADARPRLAGRSDQGQASAQGR